ncbi:hypothetical protein D9M69_640210 [compost metagenome]
MLGLCSTTRCHPHDDLDEMIIDMLIAHAGVCRLSRKRAHGGGFHKSAIANAAMHAQREPVHGYMLARAPAIIDDDMRHLGSPHQADRRHKSIK